MPRTEDDVAENRERKARFLPLPMLIRCELKADNFRRHFATRLFSFPAEISQRSGE